jgi:multiple sugar transport system permease protein
MTLTAARPVRAKVIRKKASPAVRKQHRAAYILVLPFLVFFTAMLLAPLAYAAYLSLFRTQLIGGRQFAGLENYRRAFTDPSFLDGLQRVALFLVVQVPIMLFLALVVALAIDSGRLYGAGFFRVTIFLPYAVPAVVAALMWGFMYGARFGLIGNLSDALHVQLPDPLKPSLILASIGNISTWEFAGYNMLIFYSALRVVPKALYESAEIDGAGQLRIIRSIKLPQIRGALVIATIFSVIGSFQLFNEPSILKALAPNAITTYYTPNFYAYSLSFAGQQVNYSAAIAVVMAVLTVIVAYIVQLRGFRGVR